MTTIVHLTDLHFGATDPDVTAALLTTLQQSPPNLLAVSGDLTQGARRTEFRAAMDFLNAIPAPALIVPGNHDITPYKLVERFLDPYRRWRAEVNPQTQPTWHDATVAVVGLNTARRFGLHLDWSRGRVTASRLRRVTRAFAALPASLVRIVVAHHPLLPPENQPEGVVVGGATRALASFARQNVRLVLAGHLHRSYARLETQNGPGPLILQGGSATSIRLRGEPNAYNRIDITQSTITIDSMAWSGTAWRQAASRQIPV